MLGIAGGRLAFAERDLALLFDLTLYDISQLGVRRAVARRRRNIIIVQELVVYCFRRGMMDSGYADDDVVPSPRDRFCVVRQTRFCARIFHARVPESYPCLLHGVLERAVNHAGDVSS